jgi:hypothetical protein
MNLWQKLTIDWPCGLGDWLWLYVVMGTAEFLRRLTFRLVLRIAFIVLLLAFFQHVMALDLAFLFYIDVASLPEIAAALFAVVAAGFAGKALGAAARAARPLLRNIASAWARFGSRQPRTARTPRRKLVAPSDDDEPARGLFAFA